MLEEKRKNIRSQFLKNEDRLVNIIENLTGHEVERIVSVTITLDDAVKTLLDCIVESGDEMQRIIINTIEEEEE